jgi:hypothetical protein
MVIIHKIQKVNTGAVNWVGRSGQIRNCSLLWLSFTYQKLDSQRICPNKSLVYPTKSPFNHHLNIIKPPLSDIFAGSKPLRIHHFSWFNVSTNARAPEVPSSAPWTPLAAPIGSTPCHSSCRCRSCLSSVGGRKMGTK